MQMGDGEAGLDTWTVCGGEQQVMRGHLRDR